MQVPPRRTRSSALPVVAGIYILALTLLSLVYGGTRVSPEKQAASSVRFTARVVPAPFDGVVRDDRPNPDGYHGFCTGGGFLSSNASLALYIPVVFIMFVGLALVTDDFFVSSLEAICEQLHLSEDVAGATFMAAGSSAPELFTSLLAVFVTKDDVGVGTVVGSAVFNILVIIGLSAALAGKVLALDWRPLARDSAFYVFSIILLLVTLLGWTRGEVGWWEGLIMMAGYALYILFMKFLNRPYMNLTEKLVTRKAKKPALDDMETGYGALTPRSRFRSAAWSVVAIKRMQASIEEAEEPQEEEEETHTVLGVDRPSNIFTWVLFPITFLWSTLFRFTIYDCGKEGRGRWWPITFAFSIVWIGAISYAMVESARKVGCIIGIPSAVMGLTVLAAGTSVPDALASVAVARQGRADMAVSNAIGSNVFDILLGLGLPWFLGGLILKQPQIVTVEPLSTVIIPIAILFVMIVALIVLLIVLRWKLRPLLGYILFGLYVAFVAYQLLDTYVFEIGQT